MDLFAITVPTWSDCAKAACSKVNARIRRIGFVKISDMSRHFNTQGYAGVGETGY